MTKETDGLKLPSELSKALESHKHICNSIYNQFFKLGFQAGYQKGRQDAIVQAAVELAQNEKADE
jgi:hypothetical protein